MSHSFSLISTLAIGFAIAWALGFLMERIKVPALVGYLLAGIIISPATPGFVGDVNIASELSEIGVMPVSYTHLDGYGRMYEPFPSNLSPEFRRDEPECRTYR